MKKKKEVVHSWKFPFFSQRKVKDSKSPQLVVNTTMTRDESNKIVRKQNIELWRYNDMFQHWGVEDRITLRGVILTPQVLRDLADKLEKEEKKVADFEPDNSLQELLKGCYVEHVQSAHV